MKKIFTHILLLLVASAASAIDVQIPDVSAAADKDFTLAIRSSDLTGAGIYSVDMKVIFDASLLTATSVSSSGSLMGAWGNPTFNISSDNVRVSGGGTSALSGSGTLIKIRFKVNKNAAAGATGPIAFAAFQFNEGSPTANLTNGTFTVVVDSEPPVITQGPTAESVTTHSATITWRTDEPATSIVDYGPTASYGKRITSDNLVTNHSVAITGLAAGSSYHFRVSGSDKLGNGPVTSDDFTFKTTDIVASLPDLALDPGSTLLVPLKIGDLSEQEVTSFQLTVTFDGDILSAAGVSTEGALSAAWPSPTFSTGPGRIQVQASGASPLSGAGTLIYLQLEVYENAAVGRQTDLTIQSIQLNNGSPAVIARHGSFTVTDTKPPEIISGPEVVNFTSTSAEIVWSTNEKSTSRVEYGTTTEYGYGEVSSEMVFEHKIALSGLSPETGYYFRVSSSDSSGNGPTFSPAMLFTTNPGGSIRLQVPDQTAQSGTTVSVPITCSEVSGAGIQSYHGVINYDRNKLEFLGAENGALAAGWPDFWFDVIDGQILISNSGEAPLEGAGNLALLRFKVLPEATDGPSGISFGRFFFNAGWPEVTATAGQLHITGNPDTKPPAPVYAPIVDFITPSSARVVLYTDEPARVRIEYGTSEALGQVAESSEPALVHEITLQGLQPSTTYYFSARLTDQAGNESRVGETESLRTLPEAGLAITLPSISQAAGSSFDLAITSANLSGLEVYSAYIVLRYDENLLSANNVSSGGTLTAGWGDPVYTISPGRIVIAMGGVAALRNSGELLKLNFSLNPSAEEGKQTPLFFEQFTFNEGTPQVTLSSGSVLVKDSTAPQINKGPVVFGLTQNSATVLWATSEPATGEIRYGQSSHYEFRKSTSQLATGHMYVLSGLHPNTTYHYSVTSYDASGNGPAESGDRTFTTPGQQSIALSLPDTSAEAGAEIGIPVSINGAGGMGITSVEMTLTFDSAVLEMTGLDAAGSLSENWNQSWTNIAYGRASIKLNGESALSGSGKLVTVRFRVSADAAVGTQFPIDIAEVLFNGIERPVEITTGTFTVRDNSPPQITNGPFASAVTTNSAEIVWYTDEPADSRVSYGTSQQYGLEISDNRFVFEHRLVLENLDADTEYHYIVAGSDSFGNGPTTSGDNAFRTLGLGTPIVISLPDTIAAEGAVFLLPVRIANPQADAVTSISFELFYDADVIQLTGLNVTGALTRAWGNLLYMRKPSSLLVTLSGTSPISAGGILINLSGKVNATTAAGAFSSLIISNLKVNGGDLSATGENGSLRIVDLSPPQFIGEPKLVDLLFNSAVISWETSELTTAVVEYGYDQNYGRTTISDTLAKSHTVTLAPLEPERTVHFRIAIKDSSNNGPVYSDNQTFTTPAVTLALSMPDTTVAPNQNFVLPIRISRVDGFDLTRISLNITYDPALLSARGVSTAKTLTAIWRQPAFSDAGGQIHLEAGGAEKLTGQGVLINLLFQAQPTATPGEETGIEFGEVFLNDGAVKATDVFGSRVSIDAGDSTQAVSVGIPQAEVMADSTFQLPIHMDTTATPVNAIRFKMNWNSTHLSISGIDTAGALVSGWTITDLLISDSSLVCQMNGQPPVTAGGNLISIEGKAVNLRMPATTQVAFEYFVLNGGYPPVEAATSFIPITLPADLISGYVLESESRQPVDSALVRLEPDDRTTYSDSSGYFRFTGLDTLSGYTLSASKAGYSLLRTAESVAPGNYLVELFLEAKNGVLKGSVHSNNGAPIAKALIVADDGAGNFGSANSDSSGWFEISGLAKTNPYTVRISKYGYIDLLLENIAVNSELDITLEENYGTVSGQVTFADESPAANINLLLSPLDAENAEHTAVTDESGQFQFAQVTAGDYVLAVNQAGYMSEPEQHLITLGPGQSRQAEFVIEPAVLHSLTLQVGSELPNDKPSPLYYIARTESGRIMSIPDPEWTVIPQKAGKIDGARFNPNPAYLGNVTLIATDKSSALADTALAEIYAPVGPETDAVFENEEGVEIIIPPGAFREGQKLKAATVSLPPFKQNAKSATAVGKGLQLKPDGYALDAAITIKMPAGDYPQGNLELGQWHQKNANWAVASTGLVESGRYYSASFTSLGLYALLVPSKPLGIESLEFLPNPFSPDFDSDGDGVPGLTILLRASSRSSRTPFVTFKIYNMLGQPVRTLAERRPVSKDSENRIVWDGKTDDGLMARNGRYVIHTVLEDATGKKEKIDTVVLIR